MFLLLSYNDILTECVKKRDMSRIENALSRGADIDATNRVSLFHLLYMGKYNIFIISNLSDLVCLSTKNTIKSLFPY